MPTNNQTDDNLLSNKKAKTRTNILSVATKLFLETGYIDTDMTAIAQMADIDKRTIYRYFPTKESLAFTVWTSVLSEILQLGHDAKGANGYLKLEYMLSNYINTIIDNKNKIKFLAEFDITFRGDYPPIAEAQTFVDFIKSYIPAINIYLNLGVKDGSIDENIDIDLTGATISNIMLSLSQRVVLRAKHLEVEQGYSYEVLNESARIVLRGIKAN